MSKLFGIESRKIRNQKELAQYSKVKMWILKLMKVRIPKLYEVDFYITLQRGNGLLIGDLVTIGDTVDPLFRVIGKDPNDDDNRTFLVMPNRSMDNREIKVLLQASIGFLAARPMGEDANFKRKHYSN